MAAHLNRESKFGAGNTWQSYGYDQFFDCLGKTFGYDASTGIANIRPSVGVEILRGDLDVFPHSSGYEVYGSRYDEFIRENTRVIDGVTVIPGDQDRELRRLVFLELQDPVLSVEYLAANIERGVDRAIGKGITPSVFNLASWLWRGVQTRREFQTAWEQRGEIRNTHGAALVSDMPMAFRVLGLAVTPYNAYNSYEADLVDGSFYYVEPPPALWP